MRRLGWSRVLIVVLFVALISLGGCGGGGGGDKGGGASPAPTPSPSPTPAPSPSPSPSPSPTPNPGLTPDPAPSPTPTPGAPVDLSRLHGDWKPYDGAGTFTGPDGEEYKVDLSLSGFVMFRYISVPNMHTGEVMVGQFLTWNPRDASGRRFSTSRHPNTPFKTERGKDGTKILFGDGSTMEIIDPKNPAYFIVHEEGSLYERGVPYRYDLSYRIEKKR